MVFGKVPNKIVWGLFAATALYIISSILFDLYLVPLLLKPGAPRVPYGNALPPMIFGSGILGAIFGWMLDLSAKKQSTKTAVIGIMAGILSLLTIQILWSGSGYPVFDASNIVLFVPVTAGSGFILIVGIVLFLRSFHFNARDA